MGRLFVWEEERRERGGLVLISESEKKEEELYVAWCFGKGERPK